MKEEPLEVAEYDLTTLSTLETMEKNLKSLSKISLLALIFIILNSIMLFAIGLKLVYK
jgi:hypothetical protein